MARNSGPILQGTKVAMVLNLPAGVVNLTAGGMEWSVAIIAAAATSPAIISARYAGPYPVAAGAALPPLVVSGTLTAAARPALAAVAIVVVPGDHNPADDFARETLIVGATPGAPGAALLGAGACALLAGGIAVRRRRAA